MSSLKLIVRKNNKNIGSIYYGEGGEITTPLYTAGKIKKSLESDLVEDIKDDQLKLVRVIENRGGGLINNYEIDFMKKKFPNEEFVGNGCSDQGLLAISDEGQNSFDAKRKLILDLDQNVVFLKGYKSYKTLEELLAKEKSWSRFSNYVVKEEVTPFNPVKISEITNYCGYSLSANLFGNKAIICCPKEEGSNEKEYILLR